MHGTIDHARVDIVYFVLYKLLIQLPFNYLNIFVVYYIDTLVGIKILSKLVGENGTRHLQHTVKEGYLIHLKNNK